VKILKATYSNQESSYGIFCDECFAEADGIAPKGMWNLSCGHHLCSECTDYGMRHNKKPHQERCPDWKIGAIPSDEDEAGQRNWRIAKVQEELRRQGYQLAGTSLRDGRNIEHVRLIK